MEITEAIEGQCQYSLTSAEDEKINVYFWVSENVN